MEKYPLPEGVPEEALHDDARVARGHGLKFEVTKKAGRGQRWETVEAGLEDLVEAVSLAGGVETYESGVFVRHDGVGCFIYWTSLDADLLNSTVLHIQFDKSE